MAFILAFYSDILFVICFMAFSLACVRVQAWPAASGAGDKVFRSRRGPLHPEITTWLGGEGGGRRRRTRKQSKDEEEEEELYLYKNL